MVPNQDNWQPQLVSYVHHKWHTDTICEIDLVKPQEMSLKSFHTVSYVVVHFGDIPAECIARVVAHDQTFLREIPSEVGRTERTCNPSRFPCIGWPIAGPRSTAEKARSHRELCQFRFAVSKFGLTENCSSVNTKGTEVDKRTSKLYSKQGNIDITEPMTFDEMTQCDMCKEHNARGNLFCK